MEAIGIVVLGVIALLAVGVYIWSDNKTTNKGVPKKGGGGRISPKPPTKLK